MRQRRQAQQTAVWSTRTLIYYGLLQLPELLLLLLALLLIRHWVPLPPWLFWGLIAASIAKDVVLFPFVWKSYDPDAPAAADAIIGEVGVTRQWLAPIGYIRVCGVLWRAQVAGGGPPVEPGKPVKVEERHGLTLIVVPEEDVPSPREAPR